MKSGVKSFLSKNSGRASQKKTVSFITENLLRDYYYIFCKISGPLFDDGSPYSVLDRDELYMLKNFLIPDWDSKLQALPTEIQSRKYWLYGIVSQSSETNKILGSVLLNMRTDDGVFATMRHLVIDE